MRALICGSSFAMGIW